MQDKDKDTTPSPTKHTSNPRSLHAKRSFASKHPYSLQASNSTLSATSMQSVDSPAYDASEEDNDPLTDSGASAVSVSDLPTRVNRQQAGNNRSRLGARPHALASSLVSSDEAVDSPTYDGDIESSATLGADPVSHTRLRHHQHTSSVGSVASTLSPTSPNPPPHATLPTHNHVSNAKPPPARTNQSPPSLLRPTPSQPSKPSEPSPATTLPSSSTPLAFDPAKLTPEDIQSWFQEVIAGPGCKVNDKWYKINPPPKHRPVRIYADGVYDLFHFGHALQLRQAKLAFPSMPPEQLDVPVGATSVSPLAPVSSRPTDERDWVPGVYMLAGVNSDEQCEEHKSKTVMTHAERCESVRHCRWIDEVVPDAPWVIDGDFLAKYDIDYVAHDADPYFSAGHDDVYAYCKIQGKFLPTRRTPGISTSDLLARLVSGYRHRVFDKKLAKMGMHELMAEGSDWDESRVGSRAESQVASQVASRAESPTGAPTVDGAS